LDSDKIWIPIQFVQPQLDGSFVNIKSKSIPVQVIVGEING
jgi:hypothetical protein